ncbi:MAG TPA: GTP 3',8-cyclase MoaA [Terriglobia bacterium]|nr:GTP 3',8-cyclase MoaA [Terriglobia bacterium]
MSETSKLKLPQSSSLTDPLLDAFHRPMRSLRISVTDRCNLRCQYCMPEDDYVWVERAEVLTFEEITALAGIFTGLGVRRLRLTGGEPLLRHNLDRLIAMLTANPRVEDLALTTNGVLLARKARRLREAGLRRVTVSLDTLRADRFQTLAKSSAHAAVLAGIDEALHAGFESVKLNTVVIRGFNEDEIPAMIEFGRGKGAEIRFIEYMDVGGATRWSIDRVMPRMEILAAIEQSFGVVLPIQERAPVNGEGKHKAPAERFKLADGTTFGIISSTSEPFCGTCDRSRLTTDGVWLLCLYAASGIDLKSLLRRGDPGIGRIIQEAWTARMDRGAEERKRVQSRGALYQVADLRKDLHREMHTRGG